MHNIKPFFLVLLILCAGFCLTDRAAAQVLRIDACGYPTVCVKLTPSSGSSGTISQDCWGLPVLEDGWTEKVGCMGPLRDLLEYESYSFPVSLEQEIVFVEKVKLVPALGMSLTPYMIVEDIFILPCRPASATNPRGEDFKTTAPPPMVFLDDVTFPPIFVSEQEGPTEYLCAVIVPLNDIVNFFGPTLPVGLDWFAIADLDALGDFYGQPPSPDTDGNGCPDSCIELTVPGYFVSRTGIDEKGAGLVNYLLNHAALGTSWVEVFEPQPSSLIPPLLPGMSTGESHNTRPWCFTLDP